MRDLRDFHPQAAAKALVVHLGIDPRIRRVAIDETRAVLTKYALDRPFVIYPVGTMDRRKNLRRTREENQTRSEPMG